MRTLRGGVLSLLALSAMLPIFHRIGQLGVGRSVRADCGSVVSRRKVLSCSLGLACLWGELLRDSVPVRLMFGAIRISFSIRAPSSEPCSTWPLL